MPLLIPLLSVVHSNRELLSLCLGLRTNALLLLKNVSTVVMKPQSAAQKLQYIYKNPVEAGIVEKAEKYIYSSARDYYDKECGLKKIEFWLIRQVYKS